MQNGTDSRETRAPSEVSILAPGAVAIAHRLGTVRHADVIFVVKDCGLAEQGTHEALMVQNGVYAELCRIQTPEEATIGTAPPVSVPQ